MYDDLRTGAGFARQLTKTNRGVFCKGLLVCCGCFSGAREITCELLLPAVCSPLRCKGVIRLKNADMQHVCRNHKKKKKRSNVMFSSNMDNSFEIFPFEQP